MKKNSVMPCLLALSLALPARLLGTSLPCCGPNAGPQAIQWLQAPGAGATALLPDPLGLNSSGTWLVTNLPCYGRVLITQTFPDDSPDLAYWFLNANFENVPAPYGSFADVAAGYGPYSWGTFGSLLDFYNGHSNSNLNYQVNFYFLDGEPNPCTLYLAVVGLASATTVTVSQPVTFQAEYDLQANAPGGNGNASANTTLNGLYGAAVAGASGTVVGSAYSLNSVGDPSNTGWAVLQPTNGLTPAALPPGSGTDLNSDPYPPAGFYPCLTLTVNQEGYDGIGFTVGYVCCANNVTNCLQVECPTNKTESCDTNWSFDLPSVESCCGTNYSISVFGADVTVATGNCSTSITRTWLITDCSGETNFCSQTVTVAPPTSYTLTLPPGTSYIANQLNHVGGNSANLLFTNIGGSRDFDELQFYGCSNNPLYYFDSSSPSGFDDSNFSPLASAPTLSPGQGVAYVNNTGVPETVTFTGTPMCPPSPVPLCPCGTETLVSYELDCPGTYEDITGLQPQPGVKVLRWNGSGFNVYTYAHTRTGNAWSPSVPVLNVGESAFILIPCPTGCLQAACSADKTVACGSVWTFDPPTATTCCTNLIQTTAGTTTTVLITPVGTMTNGVCPQVEITQNWLIMDGCGDSNICSQTVTVIGCCTNQCCGTNAGPRTIQWLQAPGAGSTALLPDPLGLNTNGTWIITNLPCYGRVLITQTFPDNSPDLTYWFLNPNFENVPAAYGSFADVQAGYGPYSWGTFGSLLDFYNGHSNTNINYLVNFYFLDGAPNPCTLYLGVAGLASATTATVSQPVTFRAEYDLQANAPGGNGNASANTTLNGLYGAAVAGASGTVVGSAYSQNHVGDPSNTGWTVLQPTNVVSSAPLPSGGGTDMNGNVYPPAAAYPCLTLAVNQEAYDGIGFTVGYVCCTNCATCGNNCLQVQCPTNKTVMLGGTWAFDAPVVTTCCTNLIQTLVGTLTNVLILPTGLVTNGACPQFTITQSWLIEDGCGNSNTCSQTVTVLCGTGSNCCAGCTAPYPDSYVMTVLPGTNYLADSLCQGTNNTIGTLFPNGNGAFNGMLVYVWDPESQTYLTDFADSITSSYADGWINGGGEALAPGAGFIVINNSTTSSTIIVAGCQPDCPLPCLPGNQWSLVSGEGTNAVLSWTNLFSCPPVCGTELQILNPVTQQITTYTYINGAWTPALPIPLLQVGQSAQVEVNTHLGLLVTCPPDKTVQCGSPWTFDVPVAATCCTELLAAGTAAATNVFILPTGTVTNGVCPQVAITQTWLIVDGCGDSNTCSQTVTVLGCCTNTPCLQVLCPLNKTVPCDSAWTFDAPTVTTCCTNQIQTTAGTLTNVLITSMGAVTNGVCPQVAITQTWLIVDGCGDTNTCSQTVTVIGCCNSPCCGTNAGPRNIQWLQTPTAGSTTLAPDPLGLNTNGTWIITNLPCYGRVLITQTCPDNSPDLMYWFLNPNFENVPAAYGSFADVEAGYGPYSWGTFGSLLDFYNGHSNSNINYQVHFYFLDGTPNPCALYLGVAGLASATTTTVSQPVTFRAEYDLQANAPGGNGYASANTTLNGLYGAAVAGASGTVVGSANSLNHVGDPSNTGWAVLQPTTALAMTNLPAGSGMDMNANTYPAAGNYPCLTLTVNQEGYDGIGFTVGYVCCTNCTTCGNNCLQVECPTNKTVPCNSAWSFDTPTATTCCTNLLNTGTGTTSTVLITPTSRVTNGVCPQVEVTQNWLIVDGCGASNTCSQTVTVLGCCTNCFKVECPTNKTVKCGTVWKFDGPMVMTCCTNLIDSGTAVATNLLIIPMGTVTNGACPQLEITQHWLIVDGCGDSNTCSQTVTVLGCCSNCLSVKCPTNMVVTTCSNCAAVHYAAATVTDTCCSNNLKLTYSMVSGSCFPLGTNYVQVTASDGCGNTATCDFIVKVTQNNCPPIISVCPANFVLCAGTNGCATMPDEIHASSPILVGLFNTAVASGFTAAPLPVGTFNDPHWTLVSVPVLSSANPLEFGTNTLLQANPAPAWVAADNLSGWIAPANDGTNDGPEGNYDYQTSFVLPAEGTVTVSGQMAADDYVVDVLLNGVSTGLSTSNGLSSLQWNAFTLSGAGLAGTNTLDFIVHNNPLVGSNPPANNQDTPTGLLVEFNTATLNTIPFIIPAAVQATNCDGTPASGWQSIPPNTRLCNSTNIIFTFTNACGDAISRTSSVTVETCCVVPPSGMVLWLTLDETVGDTCLNSAGYNNGTRYEGANPATPANGPTHTLTQYVDNSLCFDGSGDKVVVPDYAAIDFGTQNFTMDAWVRWNGGNATDQVLLDHRFESNAKLVYGYHWFIANGKPGVQLATGQNVAGPYNNFTAANAIAPNVWTHLAVTVQRGSNQGLLFYTNGVLSDKFNLTGVVGSLYLSQVPLWIGASPLTGNVPFNGCLDEIELFNRVLPASQIAGIYNAGRTGKCRPTCSVPSSSSICYDDSSVVVPVAICNSGSSPMTLTVSFNGLTAAQAGGSPAINGPTVFTAYPATVTLAANTCTNFTVTIARPPGLTTAKVAYYQMVIHDSAGQQFSSIGKLTDLVSIWCSVVNNNTTNQVHVTQATNFVFRVNNPASSQVTLNSEVLVLDGSMVPETNLVSLNGLAPGTPLTNQWVIPAFGSQLVTVNVNYLDAQPWTPFNVVLLLNLGDNGALIPVASTGFAQVILPTTGPLLTTSTTNGQVVVSWDLVNTGWTLQSKFDLRSTNWIPVSLPVLPQADGSQGVTLPLTNQAQFFQLIGPSSP